MSPTLPKIRRAIIPPAITNRKMNEANELKTERWMRRRNLGAQRLSAEEKKLVTSWFMMLDSDGDGAISVAEMSNALLSTGSTKSSTQVEQMVARLDVDGDGEVSLSEFLRVFTNATELEDIQCAAALRRAVQELKTTMQDIGPHLTPSLTIGIAKRKATLDLFENIYSTQNTTLERIQVLKEERQKAFRMKDKAKIRQTSTELATLQEHSDMQKKKRCALVMLVPEIA